MKKWCYILPVLLLLTGCASQKIDTTPVWQETLPNTGVEMQLSNCILLNTYHVDYAQSRETSDQVVNRDALNTQGVPVITLYGVTEDQVELTQRIQSGDEQRLLLIILACKTENVAKTKELVAVAHAMGMSIEAEVGSCYCVIKIGIFLQKKLISSTYKRN